MDFTKKNIFHDLVIESNEKMVLWRGWDLSKQTGEDAFILKRKVSENVDFNLESAFRSQTAADKDDSSRETALSLQYNYEKDQSFSLAFEEDTEAEVLSLKHKVTF